MRIGFHLGPVFVATSSRRRRQQKTPGSAVAIVGVLGLALVGWAGSVSVVLAWIVAVPVALVVLAMFWNWVSGE